MFALISLRLKLDPGPFLVSPTDTRQCSDRKGNNSAHVASKEGKACYTANKTIIKCHMWVKIRPAQSGKLNTLSLLYMGAEECMLNLLSANYISEI